MDPPAGKLIESSASKHPHQPFEIALVRKLESKTSSVRDAFLLLDIDGDGRISPSDVRTVLHNELGIDITKEQEDILLTRIPNNKDENNGKTDENTTFGMTYSQFAVYYQEVSASSYPASQSGLAAAVGFQRNDDDDNKALLDREKSIHLQPQQIIHQKRHQLRLILSSHSSREGDTNGSGSGMKGTSLFLTIDVHKSGKVTMQELLDWLNKVNMLNWTMEDLKGVVLCGHKNDVMEKRWFVAGNTNETANGEKTEAGMTEHEFAQFVESLDSE